MFDKQGGAHNQRGKYRHTYLGRGIGIDRLTLLVLVVAIWVDIQNLQCEQGHAREKGKARMNTLVNN